MRTVLFGGAVAAVAFCFSLVVLSWFGDTTTTEAAQAEAFGMVMSDNVGGEENLNATHTGDGMAHDHPLLNVPTDAPIPTVTHLVFPDAMDGYNFQIITQNFTFTPAAINSTPVANEGHAHLYVNGQKISRIYGNWVHLPASLLVDGPNAVSITLNANDHSEWAVDGAAISSTVIVIKPQASVGEDG